MRLHLGEFDIEGYLFSITGARMQFLRVVKDHATGVLRKLRDGPYSHFQSAEASRNYISPFTWVCVELLGRIGNSSVTIQDKIAFLESEGYSVKLNKKKTSEVIREVILLRESIWEWSRDCGLDADWCRASAFNTLNLWANAKTEADLSDWCYINHELTVSGFQSQPFVFEDAWHPGRTARSAITKGVRQRFEKEFREYLDHTEARFGLKLRARAKHNDTHLQWLVLFQIDRKEYVEIFEAEHQRLNLSSNKAVRKAINDLATFIELPLRPEGVRPGRRKSKNYNRNFS